MHIKSLAEVTLGQKMAYTSPGHGRYSAGYPRIRIFFILIHHFCTSESISIIDRIFCIQFLEAVQGRIPTVFLLNRLRHRRISIWAVIAGTTRKTMRIRISVDLMEQNIEEKVG